MADQQQDLGQPTDYKYRQGPIVERSCTDLICCVIFVVFSIFLMGIAVYSFQNGDPHRIAQPYDPDHRACGVDGGVSDYPYIYFVNPTSSTTLYMTVCVKSCPAEAEAQSSSGSTSTPHTHAGLTHKEQAKKKLDCAVNSVVKSCEENIAASKPEERVLIYNSQLFMNTVCLPTTKAYFEKVKDSIDVEKVEKISNDMITTKWVIFGSIFLALVISFIFLFLIEKLAGCVVWSLVVLFFAMLVTSGVLSIGYFYALTDPSKLPAEAQAKIDPQTLQENARASNTNPSNYLYLGIVLLSIAGVFILLICCFFTRIRLAIAILETACDYVQDNFTVVLLPFVTFFIMLAYFIWWFVVAIYLFSCGEVTNQPNQLPFGQFHFTRDQKIYANVHLFGLLWNQAYIIASVEFIISGSVTIWYFQQGPRGQPGSPPIPTAIGRFFSYHMGTVALGSLLIAIIQFIRIWLAYLYKNQEALVKKNKVFEYLFKCLMCCMWCFEKCVQFINKNAYTICNMSGKNFFQSAKESVFLIARNPLRYAAVGGFGEIFTAIGKGFICVTTGAFCYLIITRAERFKNDVAFPEGPSLLCAVVGYVVGSLFMAVYGIACDAILVVFIMDEEMEKHNGKGIALSCPPKLEKFIEEN